MSFEPNFFTTLIGSIPYNNTAETCKKIIETIDLPIWPQMVKLGFRENMYTQYGAVLPSIVIDGANEKITFDTSEDITPALETFYLPYLEENYEYFGLPRNHADGFFYALEQLSKTPGSKYASLKVCALRLLFSLMNLIWPLSVLPTSV